MHKNSWRPDWLVEALTQSVAIQGSPQRTSLILALLLFSYYWLIPGVLCAIEGTLIDPLTLEWLGKRLNDLSGVSFWNFHPKKSNILYYSDDLTHFLFTLCLLASAYVTNALFDQIEAFPADLKRAGCLMNASEEDHIQGLYRRCRGLFRSSGWLEFSIPGLAIRLAGVIAAGTTFFFFHSVASRACVSAERCWWGQVGYGIAGTYYSVAIATLVYFATEGLAAVLIGASMINLILRKRYVNPNMFAQDLANGMSPVGDFVLTSFILSLVGSMGVFIVLRVGYFGVEHLVVIWTLIIAATLFIPLATLIPMYTAMYLISESKHAVLQNLNVRLLLESSPESNFAQIKDIQPAIALYKHVSDLNILPFDSHKAFISGITLTVLFVQTVYNLIKLVH